MRVSLDISGNELHGLTLVTESEVDRELLANLGESEFKTILSHEPTIPGEDWLVLKLERPIIVEATGYKLVEPDPTMRPTCWGAYDHIDKACKVCDFADSCLNGSGKKTKGES